MPERKLTVFSTILAFALIGGAVYLRTSSAQPEAPQTQSAVTEEKPAKPKNITPEELAASDGKQGSKCYVAVDGKVYEIEQGRLWKNGEHATSQGQAHCGLDLTATITKSPHGKSKLEALPVVGSLEPAQP